MHIDPSKINKDFGDRGEAADLYSNRCNALKVMYKNMNRCGL